MKALDPAGEARILEHGEANAMIDMVAGAPQSFGQAVELRASHVDGLPVILARQLPMILFNRALCLGIDTPMTRDQLDRVVGFLRAEAAPKFAVQVARVGRVPGMDDWLSAQGLQKTNAWARLIRGRDAVPASSTKVDVRRVAPDQAQAFARAFVTGYGLPEPFGVWIANLVGRANWHDFAAFDGDALVATSSLYVQDGVGWLGIAATLPSHRGRGAQNALVARRIQEGVALGCDWFVTETNEDVPGQPNQSARNLIRQGFHRRIWRGEL